MSDSDAVLLERWQRRRDADAFTELVQRYSGLVFASCRRMLGDPAQAEDVAQECFIELMRSPGRIRASLGAWLHTMAVRRSIDRIKGDARRRKREKRFAESYPQKQEATDAAMAELLDSVDEAIEDLPEDLRTAVVARFLEGEAHTTLASRLGVAESTVRYRIEKGVARIRETLKRRGVAVSMAALTAALSRPAEAAPATLVARLGKVAVSGSVAAIGGAAASLALTTKLVGALVAVALVGAGAWVALRPKPPESIVPPEEAASPTAAALAGSVERASMDDSEETRSRTASDSPNGPRRVAATGQMDSTDFSIQGRVYDAKTGKGITGVRVQAYPAGGGREKGHSEPTGPDGRYTIPPIEDGMLSISLSKILEYPDVQGKRSVSVKLKNGERVTGIDFALKRGIPVTGTVLDKHGTPVAKADVGAIARGIYNELLAETDDEGRFVLYMPEPADDLMVQAQTEEAESPAQENLVLTKAGLDGVTLVLDQPRTASLSGVVIDGTGAGVERAQLYLRHLTKRVFDYGPPGRADAKGRFRIKNCEAGEYAVIVTPKDAHGHRTSEEYLRVTLAPGEPVDGIEIVYGEKGGFAIAGRVVDGTGKPVRGAQVSCYAPGVNANAHTDENGAFMVTGLEEKDYTLTVEHTSFSRTSTTLAAGTLDAEIVLKEQGALAGRVLRADTGAPLYAYSLAFVHGAVRDFDQMLYSMPKTIESVDGTFSFAKLSEGPAVVAVWAPGFAAEWRNVTVTGGTSTDVQFRLEPVPPFEGVVVNEAGEPVAEAGVYFTQGASLDRIERAFAAKTDEEGRFAVESLPKGAQHLCAYHPEYGIGIARLPHEKQIVLPAPGVVEGTIEIDSVPFSEIMVRAYRPGARHLPQVHTRPDADGTFRLTGLTPGELEISVNPNQGGRHYLKWSVHLESGATVHLPFVFERGTATIGGTLRAGGVPVTAAFLRLERRLDNRLDQLTTRPDSAGAFRFERVWGGDLTLTVTRYNPEAPYDPPVEDEILLTVEDGQALQQDIELPPMP